MRFEVDLNLLILLSFFAWGSKLILIYWYFYPLPHEVRNWFLNDDLLTWRDLHMIASLVALWHIYLIGLTTLMLIEQVLTNMHLLSLAHHWSLVWLGFEIPWRLRIVRMHSFFSKVFLKLLSGPRPFSLYSCFRQNTVDAICHAMQCMIVHE